MRTRMLLITLVVLAQICFAQETTKETFKKKGVENQVTITEGGMYDGTKSEVAKQYFDEAEDYAKKNDFKNAKKLYLKAIKEDPEFVEAYDNVGLVCRRMGNIDDAISYYKKSIEIYPKGSMAHQNLAVAYGMKKDYENANGEYNFLIELNPEDPEGYFGLANNYMMMSNFDKAEENALKALELYEKTNSHHLADGYYLVGLIYFYKKDTDNAKKYLQIAKDKGAKIHPQLEQALLK